MATPLVTAARIIDAWPGFANLSSDAQAAFIDGASRAIEKECDRVLGAADYTETFHPGRSRKLYAKQYPVTAISRVAGDLLQVLSIVNNDATKMRATVAYTYTGDPGQEVFTGISLSAPGSSAVPLDFATYPTVQQLADAVNALGTWQATIASNYGAWAAVDLAATIGTQGAKASPAYLEAFVRDLDFVLESPGGGVVRLYESFPDNYQFPDRARLGYWFPSPRYGGVVVQYSAGWRADDVVNSIPGNIPADLQRLVASTAKYLYDMGRNAGAYTSETIGDYQYTIANIAATAASGLPGWVSAACDMYRRKRIG